MMGKVKRYFLLLIVLVLITGISGCSGKGRGAPPQEISLYSVTIADFNSGSMKNNLDGQSGTWQSDPGDKEQGIRASLDSAVKFGEEGASLKLEYDVDSPLNAINGFWTQLRTFDGSRYDHFEFRVKGSAEYGYPESFKIEFKKFEENKKAGKEEAIKASFIVEGVTQNWQKISVPLNVMNGISDWRDIREFVITFEKRRHEQKKGTLYFDDFAFVHTGKPGPSIRDVVHHKEKKSDAEISTEEFAKFLIKRLNGFPGEVFVEKEFSPDDREFLTELARDTWGYFENIVDKEYHLPLDNIAFGGEETVSAKTEIGDYTNITNVGLYLMCLVSGYDFGFITKEEAVKRLDLTLDSIEKFEKHEGFPYNYYDITIFQETSNFVSFVDSGWLAAGIIVAKNAFPEELGSKCEKLLGAMDFSFFYDPVKGHMYHGFYTNIKYYSEYHYGAFYTEPRAISYLAIGKGDVPKEHWFMLARTFPETWIWQSQKPAGQKTKSYMGYPVKSGYYVYDGLKFIPSWGGSMFEALMPALVIDEKKLAPRALGLNDERHVKTQIKYTLEELGYPVFGMSPSSVPGGGYAEYGVKPLGMKGYEENVVTPHATFLALEFAPDECIKNLREMLKLYNAYGEYGFYDAIDVKTGGVSVKYLCLDQAMSFIALNNFLNDGAVRKRFHQDPIAKNAEELLKIEDFFN